MRARKISARCSAPAFDINFATRIPLRFLYPRIPFSFRFICVQWSLSLVGCSLARSLAAPKYHPRHFKPRRSFGVVFSFIFECSLAYVCNDFERVLANFCNSKPSRCWPFPFQIFFNFLASTSYYVAFSFLKRTPPALFAYSICQGGKARLFLKENIFVRR